MTSFITISSANAGISSGSSTAPSASFLRLYVIPSAVTYSFGNISRRWLPRRKELIATVPLRSAGMPYSIISEGCTLLHAAMKSPRGDLVRPHTFALLFPLSPFFTLKSAKLFSIFSRQFGTPRLFRPSYVSSRTAVGLWRVDISELMCRRGVTVSVVSQTTPEMGSHRLSRSCVLFVIIEASRADIVKYTSSVFVKRASFSLLPLSGLSNHFIGPSYRST